MSIKAVRRRAGVGPNQAITVGPNQTIIPIAKLDAFLKQNGINPAQASSALAGLPLGARASVNR